MSTDKETLVVLQKIAASLQEHFPVRASVPDLYAAPAFRWLVRRGAGRLEPVTQLASLSLDDLLSIDRQKNEVLRNTQQFLQGLPANNVLMPGARGTGKSSLMRA